MDSYNIEEATLPDIYFDEEETFSPPPFPAPEKHSFTAGEIFTALERLLDFVHNGRELKMLQLRLRGLTFREIAKVTHLSHGAIVRFFLRVKKSSPEAGRFLEYTPFERKGEVFFPEKEEK